MKVSIRFHRSGFTLLELLAAMGIIAMLASLLFPVSTKLIDSARAVKCTNNLKQLGILIQTAAMDNGGDYPSIENDPQNPIHAEEDGTKIWTLPELVKARGASPEILKCPSDASANLAYGTSGTKGTSYFASKGSSYEWLPFFEGENVTMPRMFTRNGARTMPPSRVRLLMDYAESGEAPHARSAESSSMHVYYADGSVRTVALNKAQ